jgi:hypothetical protein
MQLPQACNCKYWARRPPEEPQDGGVCQIGEGVGRPSFGVCKNCLKYEGPQSRLVNEPQLAPPPEPLLAPEREVLRAERQLGCSSCPHNHGFEMLRGTSLVLYSKCDRCNCTSQRVNLLTGVCPLAREGSSPWPA